MCLPKKPKLDEEVLLKKEKNFADKITLLFM
jgi:hypothetical protein